MPGYSGTPLPRKLGLKTPMTLAAIGAPKDYCEWLGPLPDGIRIVARVGTNPHAVHLFVTRRAEMKKHLDALRKDRRARVIQSVLEQPILPGVLNYLSEAKEMGLKIGLASSSGGEYVRGHLKRLNLFEYFHVTKCLEDTEAHKPDPAPYLAVLDEIGVSPREAIAFEDSPNGVAAARAAGLFCIAVPNPITQCLSLSHADHCLKSLADEPLRQLLSRAADRNGRSV